MRFCAPLCYLVSSSLCLVLVLFRDSISVLFAQYSRHLPSPVSLPLAFLGTGKTLLARALANNIEASYLKVVASAIVDKYIGESARIIREMFGEYRRGSLIEHGLLGYSRLSCAWLDLVARLFAKMFISS